MWTSFCPPDLVFEVFNATYFRMSKDSDRFLMLLVKNMMALTHTAS